jgi:hypothetical protein
MSDVSFALRDVAFLRAALVGDTDAYYDALARTGRDGNDDDDTRLVDVSALDHEGRTVLGCLVGGEE